MALQENQEFDADISIRKLPESSSFHCVAIPLQEKNTVACLSLFLLSEDGEIKSFRLITLCYGHSGLFGIADSVSISYCTAITTVLDRQPE